MGYGMVGYCTVWKGRVDGRVQYGRVHMVWNSMVQGGAMRGFAVHGGGFRG